MKSLYKTLLAAFLLFPLSVSGFCIKGEAYRKYMKEHDHELRCLHAAITEHFHKEGADQDIIWDDWKDLYKAMTDAMELGEYHMTKEGFVDILVGLNLSSGKNWVFHHGVPKDCTEYYQETTHELARARNRLLAIYQGALNHCGGWWEGVGNYLSRVWSQFQTEELDTKMEY